MTGEQLVLFDASAYEEHEEHEEAADPLTSAPNACDKDTDRLPERTASRRWRPVRRLATPTTPVAMVGVMTGPAMAQKRMLVKVQTPRGAVLIGETLDGVHIWRPSGGSPAASTSWRPRS